jgi:hypothetical protein
MPATPEPSGGILKVRQNIERLRGERGLTVETLAFRAGISYPSSWYRKWNAPQLFRGGEFEAIAEALGVQVAELFQ